MTETETTRQIEAIDAQYDSIPTELLKPDTEVSPEEPKPQPTTWEDMDEIPTMWIGNEKYGKEETIRLISLIEAYNYLNPKKVIKYQTEMKPLDKAGKNKGKLQELTTPEIKECKKNGTAVAQALIVEWKAENEKKYAEARAAEARAKTVYISQEENDKLAHRVKVAGNIYRSGNFLKFCDNRFRKVWYNDGYVLESILYQAAVSRIKNADLGIHLHIAGDTQTGKSDSVKTALQFVHPSDRLNKKFSKAWIFYAPEDELHERTILFSDDTSFTEEEAQFFRAILTSWKEGCLRGTVKNQEAIEQHIPPRISLILTSIDSVCKVSDEGQDESRYLTIKISRNDEDNAKIRAFVQETHPDISEAFDIVNVIWNTIGNSVEITQHKIIDKDLTFREFKRFLDLIKARALLMGRTETNDSDIEAIDKFLSNSNPMINSTTSGLTRHEKLVDACLSYETFKSMKDLTVSSGLTFQQVSVAIRGKEGCVEKPTGGLLSKPGILPSQERNASDHMVWMFKKFHVSGSGQIKLN